MSRGGKVSSIERPKRSMGRLSTLASWQSYSFLASAGFHGPLVSSITMRLELEAPRLGIFLAFRDGPVLVLTVKRLLKRNCTVNRRLAQDL